VSSPEECEPLTPAEQRLREHLLLLRDTPEAPASLAGRVLHTARWQHTLRPPLFAVAHLAAAAADAIRLILGGSRP
jgi:hypothetical protein